MANFSQSKTEPLRKIHHALQTNANVTILKRKMYFENGIIEILTKKPVDGCMKLEDSWNGFGSWKFTNFGFGFGIDEEDRENIIWKL